MCWVRSLFLVGALGIVATPASVYADTIILKDDSVFDKYHITRFDGRGRSFEVVGGGRSVEIRMKEVETVEFEETVDVLTLRDGSVYTAVSVVSFDGSGNKFKIRRGGRVVDVRASEVASIEFDMSAYDGSLLGAAAGLAVPNEVVAVRDTIPGPGVAIAIPELPAVEDQSRTVAEAAESIASTLKSNQTGTDPIEIPESRPFLEGALDLSEPDSGGYVEFPSSRSDSFEPPADWADEKLFSNVPKSFQETLTPLSPADRDAAGAPKRYVARWKGQGAAKPGDVGESSEGKGDKTSARSGGRPSSKSSAVPRSSALKPSGRGSAGGGPPSSDRNLAEGDNRSRARGSDGGRGNRRGSSQDDYYERRHSGPGAGSAGRVGGGSRGGSRFGGSGYGSGGGSRFGGGGYGGGGYGGGGYGGSRYGGGYGGGGYGGGYGGGGYGGGYGGGGYGGGYGGGGYGGGYGGYR